MTIDREENYSYWLRLHRLPPHFPLLGSDAAEPPSEPFLRDGGEEMWRLIDQVLGGFRSMVLVPPGQGATTLLNEMIRRLRASEYRLFDLFVPIDVKVLAQADYLNEELERMIREDIFRQFARQGWVRALKGTRKQLLLACFDMANEREMSDLEYGLSRGEPAAETLLFEAASRHEGQLAKLIRYLHTNLGISTALCFDFPHDIGDDAVLETFREVKWFDEQEKGDDFPPSALRETYFLTRQQANLARTVWAVNFNEFEIRSFNTGEVFSILNHHFHPAMGGQSYSLLNALSDEFVAQVWEDNQPLARMSRHLKDKMLDVLAAIPRGKIPYQLTPEVKP